MTLIRLEAALRRLDAAANRVERVATDLPIPSPADIAEIQSLVERHDRLREQVRGVIGRLDTIIDTAEG